MSFEHCLQTETFFSRFKLSFYNIEMAFAFGDSYLKLPPIARESAVEIDGENSKRTSSGLVRDKHGLVRLPPIVRLDSLCSTPSSAQTFPMRNESQVTTTATNESELDTFGSPLKNSHKMDILRQGDSKKLRKYAAKREDETKLINEPAVKETNEGETSFFDSEDETHEGEKARRFRLKERSRCLEADQEALPLYQYSLVNRRGSATFRKTNKLTRSRRLAKSSPELCNRKINLKQRTGGNVMENTAISLTAGLSPELNCLRTSQPRLSVHDIDGSLLSRLQSTAKIAEKPKREKRSRSQRGGVIHQPLSSPNSPVCSESANKDHKQKGRKSLNDITESVKQFIDRRRPSISPPKKQNLVEDASAGLKIEGKSCPQSEREGERANSVSQADSLHPPEHNRKKHSLYDLEQILSLLQREDLKRQASPTASPSRSSSAASNDASKTINASVYDLREFLMLAAATEGSSGRQMTNSPSKTKLSVGTTQEGSTAHLLSPDQEREKPHDGARKGSVYDLMEFLSLGNTGEPPSASTSENSSRSASPRVLFSPRGVGRGSNELLAAVGEHGSSDARRSSTYDLMEFLSLPRSGASSRPELGQSSTSSQGDRPSNRGTEESEISRNREKRSLSVYDLAEFLTMTSGTPPLVRVTGTQSEDEQEEQKKSSHKRDSVYDLGEILNVMQQEHETKRESTYNLQEILSYFHREAEGTRQERSESATGESVNALHTNKEPLASPCPPESASSGYASDSPRSTTESNNLQANDNTNTRQMSVYDLREFLSLHAAQQATPSQDTPSSFRRKISNVSHSGVSIHVTDESNRSLDVETDDVFLPVPGGADTNSSATRKRSSIYDLREFLNILNADESPLRRRLSSVSSATSRSSESESESNHPSLKSDTHSAGSAFDSVTGQSRPQLSPRQDSGGNVSLYDLSEFLSLLNTDDSPLRRRLSSAGDLATQGDSRNPRNDSEKSPLYSLGEILTVLNDFEHKKANENTAGESTEEISIPVPVLQPKNDRSTQSFTPRKSLTSQKSLTSVPENPEVKTRLSL